MAKIYVSIRSAFGALRRNAKALLLCLLSGIAILVFAWYLSPISELAKFPTSVLINIGTGFILAVVIWLLLERDIERVCELPISGIAERRIFPTDEFIDMIAKARRKIRILDTYASLMNEELPEGDPLSSAFKTELIAAVGRGVKIEVLLLNKETEAAQQRSEELKVHGLDFFRGINDNIINFLALKATIKNRGLPAEQIEVKFYDALPPFALHQVDDRFIWGFYPVDKPHKKSPSLVFELPENNRGKRPHELRNLLDGKYEELWKAKKTINLDAYQGYTFDSSRKKS